MAGFLVVAVLIAVGAFRIWNGRAAAAESVPSAPQPVVEQEQEPVQPEVQLPPYMLPDPESPEFVPDPPKLSRKAGTR